MRSFKKIAAVIMAVAMLCSFTAFAATVSDFTVANTSTANPTATVKVESDAAQNTILAYKGTALAGANVVYIDQLGGTAFTTDGVSFQLGTNVADTGTYTVVVGGTDVATAKTATFNHADATPKYDVTVAEYANGTVSYDADSLVDVNENTVITFTITPYLGYELSSLMVNGVDKGSAVVNGTFELTVTANTTVEPVFARETTYAAEAYTYKEWFDVDASEGEDTSSTGEKYASKLFFGKVDADAEKTVKSRGMALYVKDGEEYIGFKTEKDTIDTYFAANPEKVADGKYGIRFYAFSEGDYMVKSYIEYAVEEGAEPDIVYGEEIYFTVE